MQFLVEKNQGKAIMSSLSSETLIDAFLFTGSLLGYVLILILLSSFISIGGSTALGLSILLAFMLSKILKEIIQKPAVYAYSQSRYSLPSTHVAMYTIFWLMLAWVITREPFSWVTVLVTIPIAIYMELMYVRGYHDWHDIGAGFILSLVTYAFIITRK